MAKVKIIDLSVPLEPKAMSEVETPEIEYTSHEAGADQVEMVFGIERKDLVFSEGLGWGVRNCSRPRACWPLVVEDR